MKFNLILSMVAAGFMLCACALPNSGETNQNFVAQSELKAIAFAKQGMDYLKVSRSAEAEFEFRRALALYPKVANIRFNLAAALLDNNQHEEAQIILEKLVLEYPEVTLYRELLGKLFLQQNSFSAAKREFTILANIGLDNRDWELASRSYRSLAVIAFKLGDEEDSECHSSLAFNLVPEVEEARRHLKIVIARNNLRTAVGDLSGKLAKEQYFKNDPLILLQLARANLALGDFTAVERYLIAVKAQPTQKFDATVATDVKILDILFEISRNPAGILSADEQQLLEHAKSSVGTARLYWSREYFKLLIAN